MDSEWLKTVNSCSKFCINITHLNESEILITVMSELFFCEGLSTDHVIITTMISNFSAVVRYQIVNSSISGSTGKQQISNVISNTGFQALKFLSITIKVLLQFKGGGSDPHQTSNGESSYIFCYRHTPEKITITPTSRGSERIMCCVVPTVMQWPRLISMAQQLCLVYIKTVPFYYMTSL